MKTPCFGLLFLGLFVGLILGFLCAASLAGGTSVVDHKVVDCKTKGSEANSKYKEILLPELTGSTASKEEHHSLFFFSDFLRQTLRMTEEYASIAKLQSLGQSVEASGARSSERRVSAQEYLQQELQGAQERFRQNAVNSFIASVKGINYPIFRNLSISSDFFSKEGKRNSYVRTVVPLIYDKRQHRVFFAEPGLTYYNKRLTYNFGLGYRYLNEKGDFLIGGNIFPNYHLM